MVSSPVNSGTKALQGAASNSDNAQCTQTVAVQANTAYVLTAWVRGNYVYLGVTGGASTWTPSATAYTKLTVNFTTGASQTSIEVYLRLVRPGHLQRRRRLAGRTGRIQNPAPGNPTVGTVTNTRPLSWGASSGTVTGYRVYEGTMVRAGHRHQRHDRQPDGCTRTRTSCAPTTPWASRPPGA